MATTIKARFSNGVLRPLEALDLSEGDEVTVTVCPKTAATSEEWLDKTAGCWSGSVDAEKLKHDIYESRLVASRAEPRL